MELFKSVSTHYLLSDSFSSLIKERMRSASPVRRVANIITASGSYLDNSLFDVGGRVALSDKGLVTKIVKFLSRNETAVFTNGNGINSPLGFMTHQDFWGRVTARKNSQLSSIVSLLPVSASSVWMMSGSAFKSLSSFKLDAVWLSRPSRKSNSIFLLGYPVVINYAMRKDAIVFGDFSKAYTVVDSKDIEIIESNGTKNLSSKVGGFPSLEHLKSLKLG